MAAVLAGRLVEFLKAGWIHGEPSLWGTQTANVPARDTDLSVHHVEGLIFEESHTAQRFGSDYSYDLLMTTFDESGYQKPGSVYFQLKASEALQIVGSGRPMKLIVSTPSCKPACRLASLLVRRPT